jgi:hypothetical protein
MKIMLSESQFNRIIQETYFEYEKAKRQIMVINQIIDNFERIDCELPSINNYSEVYCKHFSKYSKHDLKQLVIKLEKKQKEIIDQEFKDRLKKLKG